MGVLYTTVKISQESKKQIMIQELIAQGVTEYKGKSLSELDYYTLRHVLAIQKAIRE